MYYYENKENRGANYSRNRGIHHSHGEFLAFLDDDDEWTHDKLSHIIKEFKDPTIGLVYSNYYRFTLNKEKINVYKAHRNGFIIDELLAHNIIGPTSGVVIRKECIEKCGLFDPTLPARQDYDLWLRISQKYKVSHVKKFLYIYHDSKISISTDINKRIKGRELILRKYHFLYSQKKNAYKYSLIEYYFEMLINRKYFHALKIILLIIFDTQPTLKEIQIMNEYFFSTIKKQKISYTEFY